MSGPNRLQCVALVGWPCGFALGVPSESVVSWLKCRSRRFGTRAGRPSFGRCLARRGPGSSPVGSLRLVVILRRHARCRWARSGLACGPVTARCEIAAVLWSTARCVGGLQAGRPRYCCPRSRRLVGRSRPLPGSCQRGRCRGRNRSGFALVPSAASDLSLHQVALYPRSLLICDGSNRRRRGGHCWLYSVCVRPAQRFYALRHAGRRRRGDRCRGGSDISSARRCVACRHRLIGVSRACRLGFDASAASGCRVWEALSSVFGRRSCPVAAARERCCCLRRSAAGGASGRSSAPCDGSSPSGAPSLRGTDRAADPSAVGWCRSCCR